MVNLGKCCWEVRKDEGSNRPLDFAVWRLLVSSRQPPGGPKDEESRTAQGKG